MSNSLPKVESFLTALKEQCFFKDENTQGSVLWRIALYQTRAPNRRKFFRTTGFILLFLNISLSFITQLFSAEHQTQVTSGIAWLIAIVASANLFFNRQRSWQFYIQTQRTLQFALSKWKLRTAEAKVNSKDEEGVKILQARTVKSCQDSERSSRQRNCSVYRRHEGA